MRRIAFGTEYGEMKVYLAKGRRPRIAIQAVACTRLIP